MPLSGLDMGSDAFDGVRGDAEIRERPARQLRAATLVVSRRSVVDRVMKPEGQLNFTRSLRQ